MENKKEETELKLVCVNKREILEIIRGVVLYRGAKEGGRNKRNFNGGLPIENILENKNVSTRKIRRKKAFVLIDFNKSKKFKGASPTQKKKQKYKQKRVIYSISTRLLFSKTTILHSI